MRSTILIVCFLFAAPFVLGFQEIFSRNVESCYVYRDVTEDYRISLYDFSVQAYQDVGPRSDYHFVFSPLSVWIILAAMAEGANAYTQTQMFKVLGLPNDPCIRLKYYQLATSRYLPGNDVSIESIRTLVVDQGVTVRPNWHNFVSKNGLIDLVSVPIKYDAQAALDAIRLLSAATLSDISLTGNSVLVDSIDYNGLWSTAFSDAVTYRAPFYNSNALRIGSVDLMRVFRRAKVAYVPSVEAKVLELPVGIDERYRLLIGLPVNNTDIDTVVRAMKNTIVYEILNNTRESIVPIEIAIPRFSMTSEIDVRTILESLSVKSLWTDPFVTRYISDPAALPSSFVQRSTVTLNTLGVSPAPYFRGNPYVASTGLDPVVGKDFIANRPFTFALFDAETYTCLLASVYTQPTYKI